MTEERVKIAVRGVVQGVGFRPFVHRLATELGLRGFVANSPQGARIEVEGPAAALDRFLARLEKEKPPRASIHGLECSRLDPLGYAEFAIRESEAGGAKSAFISPDIATCADCLRELFDPADRRHRYPFINCTNCGPRYTILEALPYDRPNTSMKGFTMCAACAREYRDPRDRRHHAQPNACPACGPRLSLSIEAAAAVLRAGGILALKGIGGYQLLVSAGDDAAVRRLRARKGREEKPFALMYPTLADARRDCRVSALEERLLLSPEAPIVLLSALGAHPEVAPRCPNLGVMLPYSPLHHLLAREFGRPLVATSGNLGDEPICIDDDEARARLTGIADAFLGHDRPIVRRVDDSVVRVMAGREIVLRRARGYAPLPVPAPGGEETVLAVGGHLKSAVALRASGDAFLSQHIGELATAPALDAFRATVDDLPRLYDRTPEVVACDLHPDYLSTRLARDLGLPRVEVQHHYAHALACMADNEIDGPALAVAWDGTGYGPDGTIWGGEFLRIAADGFERVAHFRPFRLPGGEAAIREPRRAALGVLYELTGEAEGVLGRMLARGVNSPLTTSAGRLFDAAAALLGLRDRVAYEGQAAMELEWAVEPGVEDAYPADLDWRPLFEAMLRDPAPIGVKAAKFHNALVEVIVQVARRAGEPRVALTGGCFQNRYLTERAVRRLREAGFRPYWHQRIPPNDGGLALGQALAALRARRASAARGQARVA